MSKHQWKQQVRQHLQHYHALLWQTRTPQEKRALRWGAVALLILLGVWQLQAQRQQTQQLHQRLQTAVKEREQLLHIQHQATQIVPRRYTYSVEEQHQALAQSLATKSLSAYMRFADKDKKAAPPWHIQVDAMPATLLTQWLFHTPTQLQLHVSHLHLQRSQKEGREQAALLSGQIHLQPQEQP